MRADVQYLPEKRILITGAGSGLGKATALKFSAAGWRVACTDRELSTAQQTLEQIQALGGAGIALPLDVTSEESFTSVVAQLRQSWGGLDVLVNNAGVATAGTVADTAIAQWQWVLNINLLGCVRGARAVIPLMSAQRAGHIVNVASFAGIANPPAMASYNAAKAAVISLSETLRFEMVPHGVGVSVVCPAFFKTNLLATSQALSPAAAGNPAPQMGRVVDRLMDKASVTADAVAADIFDAVARKRFMVITHDDARRQALLKRISPELYFRAAKKATAAFLKKRSPD